MDFNETYPGKLLTQELYDKVKLYVEQDKKAFYITKDLHISTKTLARIRKSISFDDYISRYSKRIKYKQEKVSNMNIQKEKKPKMTKERFDQVKELLFRGETMLDIKSQMGMSDVTISIIRKSASFEEYKNRGFTFWKKIKKNHQYPITNINTQEFPPFYSMTQLQKIKEELDDAVIQVIVGSVASKYKDLIEENKKLKDTMVELRARLYDLEKANIGDKISRELDKINIIPVTEEEKHE